jgi:hypothetical protein
MGDQGCLRMGNCVDISVVVVDFEFGKRRDDESFAYVFAAAF